MQTFCPEDALSAHTSTRYATAEPCIADPFAEDFAFGNALDVEPFSETPEAQSLDHPPVLVCSRVGAVDESSQSLAHLSLWPETNDAIAQGEVMRRAACIMSTVLDVHDSSTAPALQGPRELSSLNPHKAATATVGQECTAFYSDKVSCEPWLRQSGVDMDESETFSHGVADSRSSYLRYLEFEASILRSKLLRHLEFEALFVRSKFERERMACLRTHKVSPPKDQALASV